MGTLGGPAAPRQLRNLPDVTAWDCRKLAVRIPQGRSIGPFSSSTPRLLSSSTIAFTSSTPSVNWTLTPASGFATAAGATSVGASHVSSRLTSVSPNMNATELSSSKWTGSRNTSL
jgi:hypothetical protein